MKTECFAVALVLVAGSAAAQSKTYTNADLVPRGAVVARPRTPPPPSAEELRGLEARQFVYVPDRPAQPRVAMTGADTTGGPFGAFPDPVPDRRLDGSSWLEPQWHMESYVGFPIVVGVGHRPHRRQK